MNTWPFLTARWSNLSLFTFAVAPERLAPRLPAGLELDTRNGRAFVSVVGLDFQKTRVLGVGWPGFRAFPDINFRFYARRGDQRGVVFIREIVSHRFVAWLARTCYGEPFVSAPLDSTPANQIHRPAQNCLEALMQLNPIQQAALHSWLHRAKQVHVAIASETSLAQC